MNYPPFAFPSYLPSYSSERLVPVCFQTLPLSLSPTVHEFSLPNLTHLLIPLLPSSVSD